MRVDVCYRKLWEAIPIVVLNLRDEEIEQIRQLFCVEFEHRDFGFDGGRVTATADDAARWRAATEAVVAAVGSVTERDWEARRRLYPPHQFWKRLRWRLRRERLRRDYEEQRTALEAEARGAYRAYRDAAADLTDYVAAWRERLAREQREREARRRAERLSAVRSAVDGAVWAYRIADRAGHRQVLIWLPAIERTERHEPAGAQHGLTARQVQEVIEAERARDPYTWIGWKDTTGKAMVEWHAGDSTGDAKVNAWAALTGVVVEPIVWRPGELEEVRASRTNRGYGPSSNYWSPSSFGTSF
jgi:hypothetical protein